MYLRCMLGPIRFKLKVHIFVVRELKKLLSTEANLAEEVNLARSLILIPELDLEDGSTSLIALTSGPGRHLWLPFSFDTLPPLKNDGKHFILPRGCEVHPRDGASANHFSAIQYA